MSTTIEDREALALLTRRAGVSALAVTAALLLSSALVGQVLALSTWFVPKVIGLFALMLVGVFRSLSTHLPRDRLGPANQVTLARLALTALFGGFLAEAGDSFVWMGVCVASVALALDGLDGWLARRSGWASSFGAWFDMETDALLILLMAGLAWQLEKAGAWVLLSGLMRYSFVAAVAIWPWMGARLPPSRRRKAVCVLQVVALLLTLLPAVGQSASAGIAVGGLLLLCYSFAVDVIWLHHHARYRSEEALNNES